jgi:hypothetical protein
MSGGISAWPGAGRVTFPGVTLSSLISFAPAGQAVASPSPPTAAMYRIAPANTVPGAPMLGITATVGSGAQVRYLNPWGREVFDAANGQVSLFARSFTACPAAGPWRQPYPGIPEPALAVCGWAATMLHRANPSLVGCGSGFIVRAIATGGGASWAGGPLAGEVGGDFQPGGTYPYVALYRAAGLSQPLQVRVRGNDGVVRFYPLAFVVDPLVMYTADWRIYRATALRPARYELRINGVLAWSQDMNDGPGLNGDHSASPTVSGATIVPMFWNQLDPGIAGVPLAGFIALDHVFYTGYDSRSTTDRA